MKVERGKEGTLLSDIVLEMTSHSLEQWPIELENSPNALKLKRH